MTHRILTIVGARPQFIKAAVVSRALAHHSDFSETLLHTGQHYDSNMSEVFFSELSLRAPDVQLMVGSGSHARQTADMLLGIEAAILARAPTMVLVYGDTNSTLAGALAAVKLHVPVAHVEAGLRSRNMRMAEEVNRIVTDHVSALLLTPTQAADLNLIAEGVDAMKIRRVGDVMYDATRLIHGDPEALGRALDEFGVERGGYALATVHRAENTDDAGRLGVIVDALHELGGRMPVLCPLHPRTRRAIADAGIEVDPLRIRVLDPIGFNRMAGLLGGARVVVTDSGGVQKEAFFNGVMCVTLRDETEWVELVDAGWNLLAPPTSSNGILQAIDAALLGGPALRPDFYGDGHAGDKVVEALQEFLG